MDNMQGLSSIPELLFGIPTEIYLGIILVIIILKIIKASVKLVSLVVGFALIYYVITVYFGITF